MPETPRPSSSPSSKRRRKAAVIALGGVAAAGVGADSAQAMLPPDAGSGSRPGPAKPDRPAADVPQGGGEQEAPAPRKVKPPSSAPTVNPTAAKPKVTPTGEQTPPRQEAPPPRQEAPPRQETPPPRQTQPTPARDQPQETPPRQDRTSVPRNSSPDTAVNPAATKPKVLPGGEQQTDPVEAEPAVRSGHPTQGQPQETPPPRDQTPPAAPSTTGNTPANPTIDKPEVLPGGEQQTDPVASEPAVRSGHPTGGRGQGPIGTQPDPPPTPEKWDAAKRYANALDQIDSNGGALNRGLANTLDEYRDNPGVRRLARDMRDGDFLQDPEPDRFKLKKNQEPTGPGSPVQDLLDRYPDADLNTVLNDGNRKTRDLPDDDNPAVDLDGDRPTNGYQWNEGDEDTKYWHPQGITGDDDHQIVSWHGQPGGDGPDGRGRISVVDTNNDTYRHVLLVQATGDGDFDQLPTHAGGVVERGNKLYVAQTDGGVDVFNTNKIARIDDGRKDADGYKYVMPRVASYDNAGDDLTYSTLSVDDSDPAKPALVVGEYTEGGTTNVVRFDLDGKGMPKEGGASAAYETRRNHVQGVAMHDGRVYMSSSAPDGSTGELYSGEPGPGGLTTTNPWSDGVESLWINGGQLWTVTEHEGKRVVHSSPLSRYGG